MKNDTKLVGKQIVKLGCSSEIIECFGHDFIVLIQTLFCALLYTVFELCVSFI